LLKQLTVKKQSTFNSYSSNDKVIYIKDLWKKIKIDNEIDLKSIDDALKSHVFKRLQVESITLLN